MNSLHNIKWGVVHGIGHIILDRPDKANALDYATTAAFAEAVEIVMRQSPRVLLLSAVGPVFCAGADLDELVTNKHRLPELIEQGVNLLEPATLSLAMAPFPVVSAVGGPISGAGIAVALAADFVLGAQSMKLRTGYAAVGFSPDVGASYFLARRVGASRAKQWLMLGDSIDAEQCFKAGLLDGLYPDDELASAAETLVGRLARLAPASIRGIKRLCDAFQARNPRDHLQLEHQILSECARTDDFKEGIRAFMEKRRPDFKGA